MTPQAFIAKWRDDSMVATYSWNNAPAMPDKKILKRLVALNLARNAAGITASTGPSESTSKPIIPLSSPAL